MGFWKEPKNGFLGRAQIKNWGGGGGGKSKPKKRICAFGTGLRNENKQTRKEIEELCCGFSNEEREREKKKKKKKKIED